MRTYFGLVGGLVLGALLVSCQAVNAPQTEQRYYPVGVSDADPVETPEGYGNKAVLSNTSAAETGPAKLKYDVSKGALVWHSETRASGNMPQKILVIATFYDSKGGVIREDKADPVVLAPGEKVDVKHSAEMTKDEAARIAKWGIRMQYIKD
jgi:hypothetical protein